MIGILKVTAAISIAMALAACGDKPQAMNPGSASKQDTAAYAGTGSPYMDKGWKAGDKTSWEQHLKARMQNGQNDYSKAN
jgi:hypothetical protein